MTRNIHNISIENEQPITRPTEQSRFKDYPDVLTVSQSAELLGICNNTVYKLVREQQLPSRRIGAAIRIRKKDLIRFMNHAG